MWGIRRVQSNYALTGTILIADDQAANRELLTEMLKAPGLNVITVEDGAQALDEISRTTVDLVISDVMMPHLNGFEVCAKIKGSPETYLVPVILVTALSDKQDRIEGIQVGADDFLTRPVDRTELLARVRSLLKLKQRTDELERAEAVLFSLARSIEGKDPYTHGHCERLAEYSSTLGGHLGLSEEQITALRRAGVVHDIGKIAVPDAIILKPTALTRGRVEIDARAPRGRGAHLRALEVISYRAAHHPPASRAIRRLRVSRRSRRRLHRSHGQSTSNRGCV